MPGMACDHASSATERLKALVGLSSGYADDLSKIGRSVREKVHGSLNIFNL